MNVSQNWIQQYLADPLPATDELASRIGARLGGIEGVTDMTPMYLSAVIVTVVRCSKLENSDHLNLCYIDDGGVTPNVSRQEDGLVQVVCGAPNVQTGVSVVWLPPGAIVPSSYGTTDPFVLEARELRGTISNGMLASPKELAFGDSHEGLLILNDTAVKPGNSFAISYGLNDHIIDIENKMFTHRPDCFGQLGVAREVAGIFGRQFTSPDWYHEDSAVPAGEGLMLQVSNLAGDDVPRLMALALDNVSIGDSPIWLQAQLARVGSRPINNVVDITNYMMLLTGQPLHAYDYDKVAALSDTDGANLIARHAQAGEQLTVLNGKTLQPRPQAIVIATDRQAIGLAGVMGGANTEVDATTTSIILECASFDMYSIRRTSMAHGLFTDAVSRFNKGQSPRQNAAVMAQAVMLLKQLSGATPASPAYDVHALANDVPGVRTSAGFINARLGLQLDVPAITGLLSNVEFRVTAHGNDELQIVPPFWRTDIALPEDIVEEVGRLHGFDSLPLALPRRSATPATPNKLLAQRQTIRDALVAAGANELLTYSFVHGKLLDAAGQARTTAYTLSNALSPDLQYLRYNAGPSLLDKVHANVKAGYNRFAFFEFSSGHVVDMLDDDGLPREFHMLDLVYASKLVQPGAAFYVARRYCDRLAETISTSFRYAPLGNELANAPAAAAYDRARSAVVYAADGHQLGIIGEYRTAVIKRFKLPRQAAGFSLDHSLLTQVGAARRYRVLSRYPALEQDICLRTAATVSYQQLAQCLQASLPVDERLAYSVLPLDIYAPTDGDYKQTTFRIRFMHHDKTMTDVEAAKLMNSIAADAAERFNATRI